MTTKLTVQEVKDFLNDHTDSDVLFDDNSNFQSEIKSLVLQDDDLEKLIDFLSQQQAEIDRLQAELDKWKPKFEDKNDK